MDLQSENYPLPRETYNFIGNDRLVDFLVLSEENNRLHHAYLLSGDKGIGKATFAYNFARYLFNDKKNDFSKIGRDNKHSRLIESRSHPDLFVIEIDKESKKNKIDVNQARECIDFFNYTKSICNYKICIIDSLDDMNLNSANAILKVLEELSIVSNPILSIEMLIVRLVHLKEMPDFEERHLQKGHRHHKKINPRQYNP